MAVKKRKNIWYVIYRDENGKQLWKAVGPYKTDAQLLDAEIKANKKKGNPLTIQEKNAPLEDIADSFLDRNIQPRTKAKYKHDLALFTTYCKKQGIETIASITYETVENFLKTQKEHNFAVGTINNRLDAITYLLNYAVRIGKLKENPVKGKKRDKAFRKLPNPFRPEEVNKILKYSGWMHDIIYVTLSTGLRRGEIEAMEAKWINPGNYSINVQRTKTFSPKNHEERSIYVSARCMDILKKYIDKKGSIFLSPTGKPLNHTWRYFKSTLNKAELNGNFHDLRHTYAVNFLQSGGNISSLQQQLGHKDIQTTSIYLRVMHDDHIIKSAENLPY
ncbi:MAG: tyrosine-type recombinase/integrase [Candidatus Theseobacter exili]|nr:tyrosine-type recombinase/integrase [Candidatus Theseobacter exili]